MTSYYNEIDPFAAAWLRELIKAGMIAPGEVDTRSIEDVVPTELDGFAQCHFFAGIGGWSLALRQAGWPDSRPIWTGSCPCQPFSAAGKRAGQKDERHLWPVFYRLIDACRPVVVIGEQVSSSDVIGRAQSKTDNLWGVWSREIVRGISDPRWQTEVSRYLQGLPERARAEAQKENADEDKRAAEIVENEASGVRLSLFGSLPFAGERAPIQSGGGRYPKKDRCGEMRDDRDSIRPVGGLEQSVIGQDKPQQGIHDGQRASGDNCAQYNDEQVGSGQSFGDCGSDEVTAGEDSGEQRIIKEACGEVEGENEPTWIDAVFDDLERAHYTCWSSSTPACGFGAPHLRQRLYWMADTQSSGSRPGLRDNRSTEQRRVLTSNDGGDVGMADTNGGDSSTEWEQCCGKQRQQQENREPGGMAHSELSERWKVDEYRENGCNGENCGRPETHGEPGTCGEVLWLADAGNKGLEEQQCIRRALRKPTFGNEGQTIIGGSSSDVRLADNKGERRGETGECGGRPKERAGDGCEYGRLANARHQVPSRREREFLNSQSGKRETTRDYPHCEDVAGSSTTGPTNGHWRDVDWLFCRDEKWRPVRPGSFPLASGVSNRVGRLRGYGNSIVVPQATEIIRAFMMEIEKEQP